jgi:Glycosyl transferases group 1
MTAKRRATIYYACTLPLRAGGELVNFQHVASLRKQGWRAFAWLDSASRLEWPTQPFPVPIVQAGSHQRWNSDDWLVLPEVVPAQNWQQIKNWGCRLVMHNQNPYYTFRGFPDMQALNDFPLAGGICCSAFTRDSLQRWGSTTPWQVVRPAVLAHFAQAWARVQSQGGKRRQIAYMPRKRPVEAELLQPWFRALCPQWAQVPWVKIDQMSRAQVAQVLAESLIFVSLNRDEGLGLPPLEAMAAGCMVAGFTGGGGQEYATPDNGLWVGEGLLPELALALGQLLSLDEAACAQRVQAGLATVEGFSEARFDAQLDDAWTHLVAQA